MQELVFCFLAKGCDIAADAYWLQHEENEGQYEYQCRKRRGIIVIQKEGRGAKFVSPPRPRASRCVVEGLTEATPLKF